MSSNKLLYKINKIQDYLSGYLSRVFIVEKLNNWVGILLFVGLAGFCGYLISHQPEMGYMFIAGLFAFVILLICFLNLEICFYTLIAYTFLGFYIQRYLLYHGIKLPVGVISDTLIVVGLLSLLFTRGGLKKTLNEFAAHKVVIFLLVIYGYFFLQLFNPNSYSVAGWYQGFRKLLSNLIFIFICYNIINSFGDVKRYLTVLFILASISGLYGCIQEWHGLFNFELVWLMSDPHGMGLAFIGGTFRKMGTLSDPSAFAVAMSVCSILFIALLSGDIIKKKVLFAVLFIGVVFMVTGMSYSGTRTGHAMLVAAGCFFILLTANRKATYLFAAIGGLVFLTMLYGPFNSPTIARFRSTFYPDNDASYMVRESNRKRIQYYITDHPMGGGLATTGAAGQTYHPGHPLAGFQPDNGYLKRALETGTIGLINYLILYFLILRTGISGYFHTRNKEFQVVYAACLCAFFCFYIGEYAQKATGQLSSDVIYYPLMVIVLKLRKFDYLPNKDSSHVLSTPSI